MNLERNKSQIPGLRDDERDMGIRITNQEGRLYLNKF